MKMEDIDFVICGDGMVKCTIPAKEAFDGEEALESLQLDEDESSLLAALSGALIEDRARILAEDERPTLLAILAQIPGNATWEQLSESQRTTANRFVEIANARWEQLSESERAMANRITTREIPAAPMPVRLPFNDPIAQSPDHPITFNWKYFWVAAACTVAILVLLKEL